MSDELLIFGFQKYDDKGKGLKDLKKYKCNWCQYEFKHFVRKVTVNDDTQSDGSSVSTQVKCPKCTNFLKTW